MCDHAKYVGAAMNDAPDLVLLDELASVTETLDTAKEGYWSGTDLLDKLLAMPKHIRAALAKRLMEDDAQDK